MTEPTGIQAAASHRGTSVRTCEAWRVVGAGVPGAARGAVLVRAGRYEVVGVRGGLYTGGRALCPIGRITVSFGNPPVRWLLAVSPARELWDCALVELAEVAELSPCRS